MSILIRSIHKSLAEVSDDIDKLNKFKQDIVVVANRKPVAADAKPVGTLWINTGSPYNLYLRFPDPGGWRLVTTAAP